VSDAQLAAFQAKRKAAEDVASGGGLGGFGGAQAKGGAKGGAKPKVGWCSLNSASQGSHWGRCSAHVHVPSITGGHLPPCTVEARDLKPVSKGTTFSA